MVLRRTFNGTYNDFANSGLKGKVSVWIESYDLAGNPVDGGSGPGFDVINDLCWMNLKINNKITEHRRFKWSQNVKQYTSMLTELVSGIRLCSPETSIT